MLCRQGAKIGIRELVACSQQVRGAYPDTARFFVGQDHWPVPVHPDVLVALQPQTQP
ncbi:MAG: hypothetical protein HY689_12135 [Chloroflexi bacterium]|nr:hypothetical protein [Chloroflexota bacterium]